MYLKKVEIHGFKSFADRIEIEFEKGVTGIVGPNGSGKSNINDAIRWVLGEQSAKTLRGSKMEDIIFAGTTNRKPLGMAEVSLTLDNSEKKLPIDYSEVTVTRRVYRSGESEYYLNKSLCRLKDIKEIFMDTGVGIDGYSIIGQGKIDDILSNKSENRRLLFEEAAGIVKYKTRKEEAEKKLENTKQNLTRLDDIISELESRIEPLRIQSEKAKKYKTYKDELSVLEINMLVKELEDLKSKIETMQEQGQIITNQLTGYLNDKKDIEAKYKEFKGQLEELDQSIQLLQSNIFETMHTMDRKNGELELCKEKIIHGDRDTSRLDREIHEMEQNREAILLQVKESESNLKDLEGILSQDQEILSTKLHEFQKITAAIEQQEEEMERSKGNVIEILNEIASKKSDLNSSITLNNNIVKRENQVLPEKESLILKKETLLTELKEKENTLLEIVDKHEELIKSKHDLHDRSQDLKSKLDKLKKEHDNTKQKTQQCLTRKNLLQEMQNEYEGFHKSVRNTLHETKKNSALGAGIYGVVAELVDVQKEYEIAIEVALGSAMQNIICQKAEDANRVINYLKKHNLGRVTFLPIDTVKTNEYITKQKNEIFKFPGVKGYAVDLTNFSEKYKEIFHYLLGRVVIVDTIENGINFSKKCEQKYRIVSLDGDVINPGGAITGGSYSSKTLNLLSRKREIDELNQSLTLFQRQCDEYEKEIMNLESETQGLLTQMDEKDQQIKKNEIDQINCNNILNQYKREIHGFEENIQRVENELEQLTKDRLETEKNIENQKLEIKILESRQLEIEKSVSSNKNSYEEERALKDLLNSEVTNLKVGLASLEQRKQNLMLNLQGLYNTIKELEKNRQTKDAEKEILKESKGKYIEQQEQLELEIKDIEVLKKQYEFNLSQLKGKRTEVDDSFKNMEHQLEKINETIADLQDSNHKLEVRLTRLEMQQESFCNRLWEEYEITYGEALKQKRDDINFTEASKQIKILKDRIKDLGSINLNSIEEYEEVQERYGFLSAQKEDLIQAKDSLQKVIKEMEGTMKAQFIEYFCRIKDNFDHVFKKLFGGGRAELRLEDETDILNTGIEIIAQPPGKKLQNLSLLSGGERALTAIALLFSILMVKPTPFCILDEIEAALDEANVYRYASFLREFASDTQFIVVTHRKGTMESVDALYGVTMQEQGISKLVSVKLTEKAS
ncbi:chromosome segregation protein [Anaerosolibacter carboniphilus]|uniref:Chromosome partition protein Smc n=1 Tax=Anaerosolibacter carboniphilus TaxID=1417629 RepID=A0A841KVV1_9FIRM|nr:chromosome segregation protein SMC [Anaerosolibacter carboniphilus]MBB6217806.1 chromosome segregation protein [Anaerosolibacter carboniphilus]